MKIIISLIFLFLSIIGISQNKFEYKKSKTIITVETILPFLSGKYLKTVNNITVETGYFKNGSKDGEWLSYNAKGKKIKAFHYNNGKLDGHQELFNFDGSKRFSCYFKDGSADSLWEYFNNKGILIMTGHYSMGKAIGKWKIYDYSENDLIAVYDFDNHKMITNHIADFESKGVHILQDSYSGDWFFNMFFERDEVASAKPFYDYPIANDMFSYFMDIPYEFWDRYLNKVYSVNLYFEGNSVDSVDVELLKEYNGENPTIEFIISTNDKKKLKHEEFNSVSLNLLELNIKEAFMLSGPWLANESNIKFIMVYNINDWHE